MVLIVLIKIKTQIYAAPAVKGLEVGKRWANNKPMVGQLLQFTAWAIYSLYNAQ